MLLAGFCQVNFGRNYSFWPNFCLAELCSPPFEVQKTEVQKSLPEIELLPTGRSETNTGWGMLAELGRRTQNSQLLRAHRAGAPRRRSHLTEPAHLSHVSARTESDENPGTDTYTMTSGCRRRVHTPGGLIGIHLACTEHLCGQPRGACCL